MAHTFDRAKHHLRRLGFEDSEVSFLEDDDRMTRMRAMRVVLKIVEMAEQRPSNSISVIGLAIGFAVEHIVNNRGYSETLVQKLKQLTAMYAVHDLFYDVMGRDVYNVLQQRTVKTDEKATKCEESSAR